MKQVDLIISMVRNSSSSYACEKLSCHARVMELASRYCDVIIRRREKFSGQEATL